MNKRGVVLSVIIVVALLGVLLVASGYPDWSKAVLPYKDAVFSVTGDVNATVTNSSIDVNVTNTKLDVDANITNSSLDVNVTNTSFDVNVTNSTLNVSIQGTADVEIQNAELNVKTLREQVLSPDQLDKFSNAIYANSGSSESATVYTNSNNETVYLEYLTVAVELGLAGGTTDQLSPTVLFIKATVKDSSGNTLYTLYANGQMFLNLDPALPIPPGGTITVTVVNGSTRALYAEIAGIIRKSS